MKVLFSHSYFLHFDQKQLKQSKPYPPLGTIYAASLLREKGHEVSLFDTNFAQSADELEKPMQNFEPEVLAIYDDGFNYLTKMCLTNMREATFEMIQMAKQKGVFVVVSSSDSTDHYEKYLAVGADIVILGEAEDSLSEIVDCLATETTWQNVPGIVYRNDKIQKNLKRPVRKNLDELPYPAWDLVNIGQYQKAWKKHGYFSVNIATTRGCPFKCNWCAKPIYGNRYNSHSSQYIVGLIKHMKKYFNFDHIWFCDDIFGLKPNWVQDFDEELQKIGIRIPYKIQSRADLLVKEDTVKALANSGCEEVWIGAESGSQRILDAMDKGIQIEQIQEATRMMKQEGIKPCFFLQFGYLSETWEDIQATLHMLKELKPADIGVSVSYPLPDTPFYDKVKQDLDNKANWTDSDELALMFKNTYQPSFYKNLHRYIHRVFRSGQAISGLKKSFNLKDLLRYMYHILFSVFARIRMHLTMKKSVS